MRIFLCIYFLIGLTQTCSAQSIAIQKKIKNHFFDSTDFIAVLKNNTDFHFPESGTASDEGNATQAFVPSVLHAGRDLFASIAAFHFNTRRFRAKGFAPEWFQASMNDIPMNQLSDGMAQWSSWGGLNEIMGNTQSIIGLKENDFSFGGLGSASYITVKASKLRAQNTLSFFLSNRSYKYRVAYTSVIPFNKQGWSIAFSISNRMGNNIVIPGSYMLAPAYFFAVDKKWPHQLISFTVLGSVNYSSRTSATSQEAVSLYGSAKYNPNWGYQAGQIRNANMQYQHFPLAILSYEYQPADDIQFSSSLAFSTGEKRITGLDWYQAADPRPDYYRYLPSFQTDSLLQIQVQQWYQESPSRLQINWDQLFQVNRNNMASVADANGISGNTFIGLRSRYIVEDRVLHQNKFSASHKINFQITSQVSLLAYLHYQLQQDHSYKKINDLLGGEFYINWNQFAENQIVNNNAVQNDLEHPNKILYVGDAFGYNYIMNLQKFTAGVQMITTYNRFDFFWGIELNEQTNQRIGLMRNGVFPVNSLGKSDADRFSGLAIKAGLTYKYNGRKYIYVNLGFINKPPYINDYYISPRTRSTKNEVVRNEHIISAEAGYILNAPLFKCRFNFYLAHFTNGVNRMSFYHDGYRNLVNYGIENISQLHLGSELSAEYQLNPQFKTTLAIAFAKYVYTNRPSFSIALDNEDFESEKGVLYIKGFPITGTPQNACSVGFTYQFSTNLFFSITTNYLANYWLSFNPLRRTNEALQLLKPNQDAATVTHPEKLPNILVSDLSAAYSFRVHKTATGKYKIVQLFLSINNLFNQSIITGGYEQLRFDITHENNQKFPSKYFYNTVANYSLSMRLRL